MPTSQICRPSGRMQRPPDFPPFVPEVPLTLRTQSKILIIDDEPINCDVMAAHLEDAGFQQTITCDEPFLALETIRREAPDVVLLDIMMPGLGGLDILAQLRSEEEFTHLPVLVLTASIDRQTRIQALRLGANDYLSKPIDAFDLLPRIDNALVRKAHSDLMANYAEKLEAEVRRKTAELEASQQRIVYCLARAAEYRDHETGQHVIRVSKFAGIIADQLGLPQERVNLIELAAPLHDVGKIGVSDSVLLKPGGLSDDEWIEMRKHCAIGQAILEPPSVSSWQAFCGRRSNSVHLQTLEEPPLLKVAALIAGSHHERWDGTGYPQGLRGEQIPLEARITAVADVFDALGTRRPYKEAFSLDRCLEIMDEGRGQHFDPQVVDALFARIDEIVSVMARCSDAGDT